MIFQLLKVAPFYKIYWFQSIHLFKNYIVWRLVKSSSKLLKYDMSLLISFSLHYSLKYCGTYLFFKHFSFICIVKIRNLQTPQSADRYSVIHCSVPFTTYNNTRNLRYNLAWSQNQQIVGLYCRLFFGMCTYKYRILPIIRPSYTVFLLL